ncbi:hypothetical protein [Flavobacterium sp. J27]|uniref:hypothetical protein n=1 Tax=Flavobacterium sp. J27 TaxID=2060419 RepID=UPI001030596F|nr:hypothetical protein [Flavobacterium sp. J27]
MRILFIQSILDQETELRVLLALIALFGVGSVFTLLITLIKRQLKINMVLLKKEYEAQIENAVLNFVFNNNEETIADFIQNPNAKKILFQKLAIKYCIVLHQNYSGTIQDKVLDFLTRTHLIEYSRKKLHATFWKHKIEAIRDLSTLKDRNSIALIQEALTNLNQKIAIEAIIALIKFNGIAAVTHLKKFNIIIDEWSQALILSVIKNNKVPYDNQIEVLRNSKNKSLQVLATRIIKFYN